MRATFPSITVEVQEDWQDHVVHSQSGGQDGHDLRVATKACVLTAESHDSLVTALQALIARKKKEYEDYIRVDGLAAMNAAGVKHADAARRRDGAEKEAVRSCWCKWQTRRLATI
ncbi:hypothetical protein BDZ89DRAFT_565595 [Hymenopellis radicata]|nr:hypothetical protein BDZ89DRAFT_565595 [Hymenopellis radicata]